MFPFKNAKLTLFSLVVAALAFNYETDVSISSGSNLLRKFAIRTGERDMLFEEDLSMFKVDEPVLFQKHRLDSFSWFPSTSMPDFFEKIGWRHPYHPEEVEVGLDT